MRTMSVCLVRPLAATMTSHSRMGLPYVASMLRIWAWSPSSTVAMVRRSFGGMLSPAWRRRSGRIGHGRFNGASAYFPDTPALPAARHGKAQARQGIRVVQDGGTQFVDAH